MKAIPLFFISLLCYTTIHAQESSTEPMNKYDISTVFGIDFNGDERVELREIEFRFRRSPVAWTKASINQVSSGGFQAQQVITDTDSLREYRSRSDFSQGFYLQLGMDRTLGERDLFFTGGGVLVGMQSRKDDYAVGGEVLDPTTGQWSPAEYAGTFPSGLNRLDKSRSGELREDYLTLGVEWNIGVNLPVSKRFEAVVQASPQFVYLHRMSVSRDDPDSLTTALGSYLRFGAYIDASIRYRFGGFDTSR